MQLRVSQGLKDALFHLAPQIQIEWQSELPDLATLEAVAQRFEQEKDAMVLLRSNGAIYLAEHPPSIPSFIGGCNDPQMLGVIKNKQAPEGFISGVTYALDYNKQIRTFAAIIPNMNSVLLVFDSNHPAASVERKGVQEACEQLGFAYHEQGCSDREELMAATASWKGNVSAMILGNQALIFDRAKPVVKAAGDTPVVAFSFQPVQQGALCGLAANDIKLGRMLGQSIVDVLVHGKAIRDIPVKTDSRPNLFVNLTTAERLGIVIPMPILKTAQIIW
ncbi:MAG: hypothetical protein JEZ02_15375 [Desulfatibacillum sp.]|nr:hypothetical protein [Desulfatibacillum sp.]